MTHLGRLSRALVSISAAVALLAPAACKPGKEGAGADPASSGSAAASGTAGVGGIGSIGMPAVAPKGLPAPADVAAIPADAVKTSTGLASRVLQAGTGKDHPSANDTAKVNYTGWTTDGKMFDSSVMPLQPGRKPEPVTFPLSNVIAGWTEGVQLMVVGEKRRFWIPQELAYKGQAGAPAGMLVFDVELLDFTPGPKPPADVKAAPADAVKEKSGLATKVVTKGTGTAHPGANDSAKLNYSIWDPTGKLLDSSVEQGGKPGTGKPAVRPVAGFFDGWSEGLQLMVVGEKRTIWVPASLAPKARPGAPPPSDVVVELELLDIVPAPKTPTDVAAIPKDATVEKSGVASKVLKKGTGTVHPAATNEVTVEYAGWTTDGKLFDASFKHDGPATFRLNGVIPGWTEAVQLMVEGEKRRVWIPEALAYKGKPGAPQGMLVFEIELMKINAAPPAPPQMKMP